MSGHRTILTEHLGLVTHDHNNDGCKLTGTCDHWLLECGHLAHGNPTMSRTEGSSAICWHPSHKEDQKR